MAKLNTAFTQDNLVELGYYNDFFAVYNEILQVYKDAENEFLSYDVTGQQLDPRTWDLLANKQVRRICEPLLKKYSFLFWPEPCNIHANAYGFQTFSVLNFTFSNYEYIYSYKTFEEFLNSLKLSIVRIISRWQNRDNPQLAFKESQEIIETRIQLFVDSNPKSEEFANKISHTQNEQDIVNHYIQFKQWLVDTGKLKFCPDAVSFAFSINKFLQKRICTQDIWEVILKKRYTFLYNCRKHPQYQRSKRYAEIRDVVLRLCFEYLGRSYDAYIQYEAERTLSEYAKPHTLYLHQGNIACLRYHHPTNDVTASIAVGAETPIRSHATRCWKCNIVFMHKNYYLQLRKQHRYVVANFCEIDEDGYSPILGSQFAAESPLKLCGYSARKDSTLTDAERQEILCSIVENGILSKAEILQYLNHFITFNGGNIKNTFAVTKWELDYQFVANLNIDDHPLVNIDEVRPYSKHKSKIRIDF